MRVIKMIGAFRRGTREFVLPTNALKGESYECVECAGDLVLAKGPKNRPHYRHAIKKDCEYYEHPSESQEHMNKKLTLANILVQS
jgi:competence CoiA-like predicted nuclease